MGAVRIFFRSVRFAWNGVRLAIGERSFRIHIAVALLVCAAGFLLNISRIDWLIILLCFGSVMAMETMNTAIEHLVDLVCPQRDPRAGKIKDLAAGAVLIVSGIAALIGIIIFGYHILNFFSIAL